MRTLTSEISVRFEKMVANPCLDSVQNALRVHLSFGFLTLADFCLTAAAVLSAGLDLA